MARVQSILTYAVPATGANDCTPPPAPIRCGCEKFVLILSDRSLLKAALRGVLDVEIKSVAISPKPVQMVLSDSGVIAYSWKYDYTIEYFDTDLTDPQYRIRKCDVHFNCCYSCQMAYTDRKLEEYVKTVTGNIVDNTDPQNPIITVSPDQLIPGPNQFTHTNIIGQSVTVPFGHTLSNPAGAIIRLTRPDGSTNDLNVCDIIANNCAPIIPPPVTVNFPGPPCKQPGGPYNAIEEFSVSGNVISVISATAWYAGTTGQVVAPTRSYPDIQLVGTYDSHVASISYISTNPCRDTLYYYFLHGGCQLVVEEGGAIEYELMHSTDNVTWTTLLVGGISTLLSSKRNELIDLQGTGLVPVAAGGAPVQMYYKFRVRTVLPFDNGVNQLNNMDVALVGLAVNT